MRKNIVILILVLFTGIVLSAKVVPLEEVEKPTRLVVDNENVYITENATVYIYSLKDYKLKKKFGKPGEGPKEFKTGGFPLIIVPQKDNIVINSAGKISYFTKGGEFIKEVKNRIPYNMALWPLGDLFAGRGFKGVSGIVYITIDVYDKNFKKLKEIYSTPNQVQRNPASPIKVFEKSFVFETYGKHVFVASRISMVIDVFDAEGKKLYSIDHPYELLDFTSADKKRILDSYKNSPRTRNFYESIKQRLVFPKNYPAISNFFVSGDKIYVMTYEQKEKQTAFFIFELKGKFLRKSYVPLHRPTAMDISAFWVAYNNMYQVIDNEEEEQWELHINEFK